LKKRLVAGNWKMNGTLAETRRLLEAISADLKDLPERTDLLVIPPFTALAEAGRLLRERAPAVALGAQNLHPEAKGAFTGEISGAMLRELGCAYVLVGHSERRTLFAERGDTLLRKLLAAMRDGLTPVLCIGENLEERESGRTHAVLDAQLEETYDRLDEEEAAEVVLAYEPVWAIGTGRTATPEQAEEAHAYVRERVRRLRGPEAADALRVLYGGSVTAANAMGLMGRPGVDGALVGGASLKPEDFLAIARAAAQGA
jgi:triosephosphate isomerase (TIM)